MSLHIVELVVYTALVVLRCWIVSYWLEIVMADMVRVLPAIWRFFAEP